MGHLELESPPALTKSRGTSTQILRESSKVMQKKKGSNAKLFSSVYSKRQIEAAIKIQKWYRVTRFVCAVNTAIYCNKRRRGILKEILSTEESYLSSLTVLCSQFMDGLHSFLSQVETQNVFLGCRELLTVHSAFFQRLRSEIPGPTCSRTAAYNGVAQLFLTFVPQFESVYVTFLTNQDKSRRMMEAMCARNAGLVKEMDKITDRNGSQRGRQFFDSLMTGPMQRLPRYQLLLKEYQKCSNLMYSDFKDVAEAIQLIVNVTLFVNEKKRDHDELRMRDMLEQNSSTEALEYHIFEPLTFVALRNCSKCEKAMWGIKASGYRCTFCGACFHHDCHAVAVKQRQCMQRKKLDFSLKKLTYLQEVTVIPVRPDPTHQTNLEKTPRTTRGMTNQGSGRPLHRSKAVLCIFDDGLGIAHIRSDDNGLDKFDFIGDLPWDILDACFPVESDSTDEWIFGVRARFQEWRFALPTKTEQQAFIEKLNQARKAGAVNKRSQHLGPDEMIAGVQKKGKDSTTLTMSGSNVAAIVGGAKQELK